MAEHIPDDVAAEQDAEEQRLGREPRAALEKPTTPDDVLTEREAVARVADLAGRSTDEQPVPIEEP